MQDDEFAFPLSFAQRRLWFLARLDPASTLYNLPLAAPFDAAVHPEVLERSINLIVARHETLRTVFEEFDGEPMQIVRQALSVRLAVIDLRALALDQQEAETMRLTAELAQQPFDLAQGPLLRTALLRLGPERHVFVLVIHHIVSDGWSLGIFWRELVTIYNSLYMGVLPRLPELPIQYADFAVWQRDQLQGARLAELSAYWRAQLADLPILQMPTDRPRPPVLSYRGAFETMGLTRRLTAALKRLGRDEGATLFMTMFAAFVLLLHRFTGQDDIVVGLPAASRDHTELEGLIGFFVNSLVLRVDASGDPSFRTLLARVRTAVLDTFAHQEMPFEKLVEELQPERDMSRNPLFQVSFQLFSYGGDHDAEREETGPAIPVNRGSATFDLAVNLWESANETGGQIEYSTDLFDPATIARFVASYQTLLRSIVADPDAQLSEMRVLGEIEEQLLLETWNATQATFSELSVHRLVEQQAVHRPDAVAVACDALTLSYSDLNHRADALARHLRRSGVGSGVVVAVCMARSCDMVVAMLAILKAGGAYLALDPTHPPHRLAFMLADSASVIVLTDAGTAQHLAAATLDILRVDDPAVFDGAPPFAYETDPEDLCYLVYTSGSTGEPKGVAIPHRGLANLVGWHNSAFAVTPADRATQLASSAFDACGWEIWPYLAAGASVRIVPDAVRGVARDLVRMLAENKITIAFVPTPLAQMLFDEPAFASLELRFLLTGGDQLTRLPPEGLKFALVNNYGPSEYSVVATSCVVEPARGASPPIGRPIANTCAYVLDWKLNPVPIGAVGELHVGGLGLARGYLGLPALTAERFVPNPFGPGRLYRTGDVVRYRADGQLEFVGRADSQIKLRGFRIELGEIEAALVRNSDVREAAAVILHRHAGDRLVAYVVPRGRNGRRPSDAGLLAALRADLAARLPEYMVPSRFVLMPELPQLPNGKIDRRALAGLDLDEEAPPRAYRAPQTSLEQALVLIWRDILEVDRVGIDDNFFEIGGHSLLAARLISRVRDWLKTEAPLQALFRAPTPALFAARLVSEATNPAAIERAAQLVVSLSAMSDAEAKTLLGEPAILQERSSA